MTNTTGEILYPRAIPNWRSIYPVLNDEFVKLSEKPVK